MDNYDTSAGNGEDSISPEERKPADAAHRAVTLVAAGQSQTQGQVQVWAPRRALTRGSPVIAGFASFTVCCIVMATAVGYVNIPLLYGFIAGLILSTRLFPALREPSGYITTDGVGLGIVSLRGSFAYQWSEILSLEQIAPVFRPPFLRLGLADGRKAVLDCGLFPRHVEAALISVILNRAALIRDPTQPSRFLHARLPAAVSPYTRGVGNTMSHGGNVGGGRFGGRWRYLTQHAKRAICATDEEAARASAASATPEHLLIGLTRDLDVPVTGILRAAGVDPVQVCKALRLAVQRTRVRSDVLRAMDPRLKRVIDHAFEEARRSGQSFVGPEHLLVGILGEGDGAAFKVLSDLGASLETIRQAVDAYLTGRSHP